MSMEPLRRKEPGVSSVPAVPAVVRPTSLDRAEARSFLADVVIQYGPQELLGRLFLAGDTLLRDKGILLTFATFDELIELNRRHPESWRPLLPILDPSFGDLDESNGFVVFGRNASGEVIYAGATRLYNLGQATLKDEIESLRIFYPDPERDALPGERLEASAPIAATTGGSVVFSGGQWVHPDYRKARLTQSTLPTIRGLILTRWYPDLTFSFMAPEIVKGGVAWRGFMNVDWEVTMTNTPVLRGGVINAGLTWTKPELQIMHFEDFLEGTSARRDAQIDRRVHDRPADHKLAV